MLVYLVAGDGVSVARDGCRPEALRAPLGARSVSAGTRWWSC